MTTLSQYLLNILQAIFPEEASNVIIDNPKELDNNAAFFSNIYAHDRDQPSINLYLNFGYFATGDNNAPDILSLYPFKGYAEELKDYICLTRSSDSPTRWFPIVTTPGFTIWAPNDMHEHQAKEFHKFQQYQQRFDAGEMISPDIDI